MVSLVVLLGLLGSALAVLPDTNTCGKPKVQPITTTGRGDRIVGGTEAKQYSWPWQVQVRNNNKHFCGASILSPDWVLCAAHCFKGISSSSLSFRAGRHTQSSTDTYEQSSSAKSIIMHESYSGFTLNNDVALVRLNTPFKFTDQVSAVCLPTRTSELPEGSPTYVTGWGNTELTGSNSVLRQVMVPIISRTVCNQRDYYNNAITAGMICAGYAAGGKDACQGDSGGPLVHKMTNGQWEQYGVVSWGSGCADALKPGVYSNIVYYKSWITKKLAMVEAEERQVVNKFQPRPFGSAFREQVEELVRAGEIDEADLPLGGAWL